MKSKNATPRKQAKQFRSKETVKAILQASVLILRNEGVKGYNTNNIAKVAGVSIGSLYQYFPNKNSISNILFEDYFDAQIDIVERNIIEISSFEEVEEKVVKIVKEIFEFRSAQEIIKREVALEISKGSFNQVLLSKKKELSETIVETLEASLNLEKNEKNKVLMNLIVDSVDSMIFNLCEGNNTEYVESSITFVSSLIGDGVRKLSLGISA